MTGADKGGRVSARAICMLAALASLALQWAWPGRWLPGTTSAGLALAVLACMPWAILALGLWRNWPGARFWSGVAALFYFCHGIAEAWAVPSTRLPGLAEALLSVVVVLASSWEGLRARLGPRSRRDV